MMSRFTSGEGGVFSSPIGWQRCGGSSKSGFLGAVAVALRLRAAILAGIPLPTGDLCPRCA